jgi:hypothetical protein
VTQQQRQEVDALAQQYRDLGRFGGWVQAARRRQASDPVALPSPETRRRVRDVLGFADAAESPTAVRVERRWERYGLAGEEVSWSVGYGPRTRAWVLKPADSTGPLPGVLALHGHDGFKLHGKEKIADGPDDPPPVVRALRASHYQGRAFANQLADAGFVVLVHDAFGWGSRRFGLDDMPALIRRLAAATQHLAPPDQVSGEVPAEVECRRGRVPDRAGGAHQRHAPRRADHRDRPRHLRRPGPERGGRRRPRPRGAQPGRWRHGGSSACVNESPHWTESSRQVPARVGGSECEPAYPWMAAGDRDRKR